MKYKIILLEVDECVEDVEFFVNFMFPGEKSRYKAELFDMNSKILHSFIGQEITADFSLEYSTCRQNIENKNNWLTRNLDVERNIDIWIDPKNISETEQVSCNYVCSGKILDIVRDEFKRDYYRLQSERDIDVDTDLMYREKDSIKPENIQIGEYYSFSGTLRINSIDEEEKIYVTRNKFLRIILPINLFLIKSKLIPKSFLISAQRKVTRNFRNHKFLQASDQSLNKHKIKIISIEKSDKNTESCVIFVFLDTKVTYQAVIYEDTQNLQHFLNIEVSAELTLQKSVCSHNKDEIKTIVNVRDEKTEYFSNRYLCSGKILEIIQDNEDHKLYLLQSEGGMVVEIGVDCLENDEIKPKNIQIGGYFSFKGIFIISSIESEWTSYRIEKTILRLAIYSHILPMKFNKIYKFVIQNRRIDLLVLRSICFLTHMIKYLITTLVNFPAIYKTRKRIKGALKKEWLVVNLQLITTKDAINSPTNIDTDDVRNTKNWMLAVAELNLILADIANTSGVQPEAEEQLQMALNIINAVIHFVPESSIVEDIVSFTSGANPATGEELSATELSFIAVKLLVPSRCGTKGRFAKLSSSISKLNSKFWTVKLFLKQARIFK